MLVRFSTVHLECVDVRNCAYLLLSIGDFVIMSVILPLLMIDLWGSSFWFVKLGAESSGAYCSLLLKGYLCTYIQTIKGTCSVIIEMLPQFQVHWRGNQRLGLCWYLFSGESCIMNS